MRKFDFSYQPSTGKKNFRTIDVISETHQEKGENLICFSEKKISATSETKVQFEDSFEAQPG